MKKRYDLNCNLKDNFFNILICHQSFAIGQCACSLLLANRLTATRLANSQ